MVYPHVCLRAVLGSYVGKSPGGEEPAGRRCLEAQSPAVIRLGFRVMVSSLGFVGATVRPKALNSKKP